MPAIDHSVEARITFERIAERAGLQIESENDPTIAVSMVLRRQSGLSFDVGLAAEWGDLHLHFEGLSCEMYPWERWSPIFEDLVLDLIAGRCRQAQWTRGGRVYKRVLEQQNGARWQPVYTAFMLPEWRPWGRKSVHYVINALADRR